MINVKISVLAPAAPIVVWVIYTFLGAGMAYGIERNSAILESAQNLSGCLTNQGYMTYLFYVCSLHTTIGYGSVFCCSAFGRGFSVLFVLLGVPITVIALNSVGKIWHAGMTGIYRIVVKLSKAVAQKFDKFKSHGRKADFKIRSRPATSTYGTLPQVNASNTLYLRNNAWEAKISGSPPEEDADKEVSLPLSFGVVLILGWIFASAQYFAALDKWDFGDALYFTFISATTVGLGDLVPSDYDMTVVIYLFIMVALALVSLLISIIQEKIENFIDKIKKKIMDQYKKRLVEGSEGKAGKPPQIEFGLRGMLISKKTVLEITELNEKQNNMVVKGVQATVESMDKTFNAITKIKDVCTQCLAQAASWDSLAPAMRERVAADNPTIKWNRQTQTFTGAAKTPATDALPDDAMLANASQPDSADERDLAAQYLQLPNIRSDFVSDFRKLILSYGDILTPHEYRALNTFFKGFKPTSGRPVTSILDRHGLEAGTASPSISESQQEQTSANPEASEAFHQMVEQLN